MRKKTKVLVLAADPFRTGERLRLDEEVRAIAHAIRRGTARDGLELVPHFATRTGDLTDALMLHRPQIVHFAGHGQGAGKLAVPEGIYLGDEYGRPTAVGKEALARLFSLFRDTVRVVVLNGCATLATAKALSEVVDYAIGMNEVVGDGSAARFAAAFYGALAMGETLRVAFDLGVSQLEIGRNANAEVPVLCIRTGADRDAVLVEKPDPEGRDPDAAVDESRDKLRIGTVSARRDAYFEQGVSGKQGTKDIVIDHVAARDATFRQ
jgi:hypothetical protein